MEVEEPTIIPQNLQKVAVTNSGTKERQVMNNEKSCIYAPGVISD
jgi:hypothetical protein